MRASKLTVPIVLAVALCAPAMAQAHVSIHPNTVPAGAFATLDVQVPGEQAGAHVRSVDMLLPAGFTDVSYEHVPGWSVRLVERRLAHPLHSDGESIDSEIAQIAWSWNGPLGEVGDGQFVSFPLSLAIPDDLAGQALLFKTVESYSDGHTVHWIDSSLDAENPAPRINITARGGAIEDLAGGEAGPEPGQRAPTGAGPASTAHAATSSDDAPTALSIAALALGALGLLAGLLALAATRRARARPGGV